MTKEKELFLLSIWKKRLKFRAEAKSLYREAERLYSESDKLWEKALIEVSGNRSPLIWEYRKNKDAFACILETGEVFEP